MAASIFKDDSGVKIVLDVEANISAATKLQIKYKKPGGNTGTWTAIEETTTSISYLIQNGELNEMGSWMLQAYVETAGWKLHGEITRIIVKETI